jgi:hypothetical protein
MLQSILAEQFHQRRDKRHVGPAQEADSQPIGIFVEHRLDDRLNRLPESGVDHVKARVAQPARHDLNASIVSVQTDLRQDDARCG